MAQEFVLPDIGEGLTEAEVVTWLIAVGDEVADGQPLCEVETAKAVVELPSPFAGVLLHQGAPEGATIAVGGIVAIIGERNETWDEPSQVEDSREPATTSTAPPPPQAQVKAMPVVRRLAKEHGVDLGRVTGTGPGGRITREDVLTFSGDDTRSDIVRLSATRRAIADHLSRSWQEIPHVTTYDDIDATAILEARRSLGEQRGSSVPLEALLIRAVIPALRAHPEFNATLTGEELLLHSEYNIALAVDTPDGLLVPVLHRADQLDLDGLEDGIDGIAAGARSRSLRPEQLQGGTFTVSNIGALGGGHGTPIIPLGTTAIVSFGRAVDTPVAREGSIAIMPRMPVSLSYDHRVIDGALGRRFIDTLTAALGDVAALSAP
jgi:pyruvate dehydrogenase E2 component (dihydrolipoamide acetyltransferase)